MEQFLLLTFYSRKVILLLEELQLPYEIECIRFEDVKKKPYIDLNPNGRVPGSSTASPLRIQLLN